MSVDARCVDAMLSGWNTRDESVLEQLVQSSLSSDLEFCDPHNDIRGHAAFVEMVKAFWAKNGECKITRTSAIDAHHDRARYGWVIDWPDGRRFEGCDAVRFSLPCGKVRRVDGFFGPLPPA